MNFVGWRAMGHTVIGHEPGPESPDSPFMHPDDVGDGGIVHTGAE